MGAQEAKATFAAKLASFQNMKPLGEQAKPFLAYETVKRNHQSKGKKKRCLQSK